MTGREKDDLYEAFKYELRDMQFSDEAIIEYIKNSWHYSKITHEMKNSLISKYIQDLEDDIKNEYINRFRKKHNINIDL